MNSRNSLYALACNSSGSVGGSTRFMKTSALIGVGPSVRKNGFHRLGLSFINFRRPKWSRPSLKFCRSCIRLSTSSSTRIEVIKSPFDFKFSTLPHWPSRAGPTIVLYFGSSNRLFMSIQTVYVHPERSTIVVYFGSSNRLFMSIQTVYVHPERSTIVVYFGSSNRLFMSIQTVYVHPERLTIVLYFGSSNRLFMSIQTVYVHPERSTIVLTLDHPTDCLCPSRLFMSIQSGRL